MDLDATVTDRRKRILKGFRGRKLDEALTQPGMLDDLEAEAKSAAPDKIVTRESLQDMQDLVAAKQHQADHGLQFFGSNRDVILEPGFMGSELSDTNPGGNGLIWIDPTLPFSTDQLNDLKLDKLDTEKPDRDATTGVHITADGAIPLIYVTLRFALEMDQVHVDVFGFDWRKNIEEAANKLVIAIRNRAGKKTNPLTLIAHSQGSLVARKALQILNEQSGEQKVKSLVDRLILLAPASKGTFSAAFALTGDHSFLQMVKQFHISLPEQFEQVLQSMSGIYQLLPWDDVALPWLKDHDLGDADFWKNGVDPSRLKEYFKKWGQALDTTFFNDRTHIILGDTVTTVAVKWTKKIVETDGVKRTVDALETDEFGPGDGTVPEVLARLPGVRTYKAPGGEHMMLPATRSVISATVKLVRGQEPALQPVPLTMKIIPEDVRRLASPPLVEIVAPKSQPSGANSAGIGAASPSASASIPPPSPTETSTVPALRMPPPPPFRRLKVFSFDPLMGTNLDTLGIAQICIELPWDFADGDFLQPGPVGEYVEVIDYDPGSNCFYEPVNLNHPHMLAQNGMPLSEGDPQFHQQMVYAVVMNTIRHFERALGRSALWSPHLVRGADGQVVKGNNGEPEFVQRLRIYPHALRQENAYYNPTLKALLFGYFPVGESNVGRNLPGGTVFTCLSYDVIAHESTHALLDGLHRYFIEPSNPDVFAFHEAFADVVALFQHFTHPEVLLHQIARTRGELGKDNLLAKLAQQFGEATGMHGALRQFLGRQDENGNPLPPYPSLYRSTHEPHARGAIFVTAMFQAFRTIYESRIADLRRVASNGTGILAPGDLHPDLVNRFAEEAAKSAGHMLQMAIRALDYVPPVDITFGEYLRAMITADYELVKDDDRRYRVAVIAAFRDWGIYPADVRSLSVESLLWRPPEEYGLQGLGQILGQLNFDKWNTNGNRAEAYNAMRRNCAILHEWIATKLNAEQSHFLGLDLKKDAAKSIRRNDTGQPVFEVHSLRPCRRIGPDGQQQTDLVVELVQKRKGFFDADVQKKVDEGAKGFEFDKVQADFYFRGGCTLIIDPITAKIRYCIRKRITSDERLRHEREFRTSHGDDHDGNNPFAFLHSC